MKTIKLILLIPVALVMGIHISEAQMLNWSRHGQEQRNTLTVNAGFDYAFIYGLGYAHQFKTRVPAVFVMDLSLPAGETLLDDFKTRIGGQVRVYKANHFQIAVKVQGVFRRYENDYVRLLNFGSDMSAVMGYYKPAWFAAGEFGFDKAIVTHFKHSDLFRADFPGVKDGWYKPATGGNFYFGLQTGISLKSKDVTLKFGRVLQQDLKTKPAIPFYVQVGINIRF